MCGSEDTEEKKVALPCQASCVCQTQLMLRVHNTEGEDTVREARGHMENMGNKRNYLNPEMKELSLNHHQRLLIQGRHAGNDHSFLLLFQAVSPERSWMTIYPLPSPSLSPSPGFNLYLRWDADLGPDPGGRPFP